MFGKTSKIVDAQLETAMIRILDDMQAHDSDSQEYPTQLGYLERLNALKTAQRRNRVSPDQMALVGGNLLGILIIVVVEQKHAWISKASGFLIRVQK